MSPFGPRDSRRPGPRGDSDDPSGRRGAERGQIILIAGFAMAVTLIALALILNAAIYTENLATRSESSGATDALASQRSVENASLEALTYANEVNDGSHEELNKNVTDAIADVSRLSARLEVTRGHVPNVSVASTTNGTEIADDSGNFTDASGDHNWTLAEDVTDVRGFRVNVDDSEDLNRTGQKEFRILVNQASKLWFMNVSYNTTINEGEVGVFRNGNYDTCAADSDSFWVNVTEGTVDNKSCAALDFGQGVSGAYDLEFRNASAIEDGSYSLTIDQNVTGESRFSGESQHTNAVLYAMEVDFTYRSPELQYRSNVSVAPGENDG